MGRSDSPRSRRPAWLMRLGLILGIVAVTAGLCYAFRGVLTLDALAASDEQFREFYRSHPVLTLAAAFLLYATITGLSIPGSVPLSLAYGWLFKFWTAAVLVSFASTTGASLAFLISRYLIGEWVQARFGERLAAFNAAMERERAFFLFTLRLIPAVPFFVINTVMGLTRIRLST